MTHRHLIGGREALNPHLIKQQNRTEVEVLKIVELHARLHRAFDEMEAETETERLQKLAALVKELEFHLQEAWGFERNADWHSWWFQVPHCTCPILDNWDRVGTEFAVLTTGCPIHKTRPLIDL